MKYVVIGGDQRFGWLAQLLAERGERVAALGQEPRPGVDVGDREALERAENAVVNCPPKLPGEGLDFQAILDALGEDTRVFACGPGHPAVADARVVDLWADEALILENARLTAEGAVASAMAASSSALGDLRCMVIGWGRVGRALTELLVALGARTTVASRSAAGRNRAAERGAETACTGTIGQALPGHDLIFNTAPGMVLDAAALKRVDPAAMLVDLASPPYGIDLRAAWRLGLRAWREPGLPGRYCPRSAARALLSAMDRCGK